MWARAPPVYRGANLGDTARSDSTGGARFACSRYRRLGGGMWVSIVSGVFACQERLRHRAQVGATDCGSDEVCVSNVTDWLVPSLRHVQHRMRWSAWRSINAAGFDLLLHVAARGACRTIRRRRSCSNVRPSRGYTPYSTRSRRHQTSCRLRNCCVHVRRGCLSTYKREVI